MKTFLISAHLLLSVTGFCQKNQYFFSGKNQNDRTVLK
jgi:hypothetical protein